MMLREGLAAGVRPLGPSPGLGADLLMCGLLALAAWWWLPLHASGADGPRRAAAWALRFLLVAWGLAIAHYAWGLALGRLTPSLTWPVLVFYFVGGAWVRRAPVSAAPTPPPDPALTPPPPPPPPPSPPPPGPPAPPPRSRRLWLLRFAPFRHPSNLLRVARPRCGT